MNSARSEFKSAIMRNIGVGEASAIKLTDLIKGRLSHYRRESQLDFSSFKKNCYRIVKSIEGEGLSKIKKGNADYFYWETQEDKNAAIDQFDMSEERAFAFSFIKEYLPELIPPQIYQSLKTEFDKADEVLVNSEVADYLGKIDFNPMGYDMHSQLDHDFMSEKDIKVWQFVFDCTFNETCFSARYQSIHNNYDNKLLTLSPQRVVLLNQQLKVLAYEHLTKTTKYFEIRKFSDVEKSNESFVEVKKANYECREKVSVICHSWVKSHFESISLANQAIFTKLEKEGCWQIEMELSFPVHFNRNEPDPFFIANYLSGFADSIFVKEPEFLRREMQRRSTKISEAYHNKICPESMVAESPDIMAKS